MNREYFPLPDGGYSYSVVDIERLEYELILHPGITDKSVKFSFGFANGEENLFSFTGVNGRLYDNDNNFISSYALGSESPFEIYGNVYSDYHNYSINRVPVNLDCSKVFSNSIDNFFYDSDDLVFNLRVRSSHPQPEYAL